MLRRHCSRTTPEWVNILKAKHQLRQHITTYAFAVSPSPRVRGKFRSDSLQPNGWVAENLNPHDVPLQLTKKETTARSFPLL